MSGESFTKTPVPDQPGSVDPDTFNFRRWLTGTAVVTRSVAVCGRPDLMGRLEELKSDLERAQSASLDDDRLSGDGSTARLAAEFEALRAEMESSYVTFTFRGLRNGELEKVKAEWEKAGDGRPKWDEEAPGGDIVGSYALIAATCTKPAGVTWEDVRDLHEHIGAYFAQTISRTAVKAWEAGGVDVPFSLAASTLTGTS